jgi:hypothetical protein
MSSPSLSTYVGAIMFMLFVIQIALCVVVSRLRSIESLLKDSLSESRSAKKP